MQIPSDRHALIIFIAWHASTLGRAVSRIRLVKFLYLADVHLFQQRRQVATGYRWRFHHYGPYAAEIQRDVDECVGLDLVRCDKVPWGDDAGETSLYKSYGRDPLIHERFTATLETVLRSEIQRWLPVPLNVFLDYIYFDTPPMRDARRGEYLRFEESAFGVAEPSSVGRPKTYASREARKAFGRFLDSRRSEKTRVPVPQDAIVDDAFVEAVKRLDAEDATTAPIQGSVDIDPDAVT